MARQVVPKFHGLRIYILSPMLYFFLIFPFMIFLALKTIPEIAGNRGIHTDSTEIFSDSLVISIDSEAWQDGESADSMVNEMITAGMAPTDTLQAEAEKEDGQEDSNQDLFRDHGPFSRYLSFFSLAWLASLVAGGIFNSPMKRYFKKRRKQNTCPETLHLMCKKRILSAPVVNAFIVTFPNALVIIYALIILIGQSGFEEEIEKEMFSHLFYLTLVASLLEYLFVFYWFKHRVHIKYLEHIFSPEELRQSIFKSSKGRIRNRFLVASGMTTFLPLIIVTFYLLLSITSVKSLDFDNISADQREILIGSWGKFFSPGKDSYDIGKYEWLFYVNAGDSLLMVIGISNGILASLLYLFLFIRWTSQDISRPLKQLLDKMRSTGGGQVEQYALVRTNDEIGELTAGFNEMTLQIHKHVSQISRMNRDLEKTVKERTREVVMQKEEIEAQKEEIEAQLDLTTLQRDTISSQKDQILDSIRYAERIQNALLPPESSLSRLLGEHFLFYKPRDIVSGDFYWIAEKEGRIHLAAADCTGHGVPGAFLSVVGITSLNEILSRHPRIQASRILEYLRDFLIHSLHQSGQKGETNDGIEISLVILDPAKNKLEFSGANRPLYLARKSGEIEHIPGDRMPIGIYEQEPGPFTNHTLSYDQGERFYLFSDGYVDQLGGEKRKTFRAVHFRNLLKQIRLKSMKEQKELLVREHDRWKGEVEQIDDILVIGVEL